MSPTGIAGIIPGLSPNQTQLEPITSKWFNNCDLKKSHHLVKPAHRARFVSDFEALATEHGLSEEEKDLIRGRKWIDMIRRGVIFFVLEKMAAVLGVSNPEVYAAFRGETIAQFQATRKVSMRYSVAGGQQVQAIDQAS